jgi:hypothetical protein
MTTSSLSWDETTSWNRDRVSSINWKQMVLYQFSDTKKSALQENLTGIEVSQTQI